MGPTPLLGVIFLAIGGFCSATNFIPFRQIKRWSWEVYWPVQAFAAWIVAPTLAAAILVPNTFGILHAVWQADPRSIWLTLLFGMAWGVGGMAFGLAIRYLGIALGYSIAIGFCIVFGSLGPAIMYGARPMPVFPALAAVLVGLAGVAVSGTAGRRKEIEMTLEVKLEAGEQDYHLPKGLAMAALAGLATLFLAYGMQAGRPILELAESELLHRGRPDTWACLPALIVILCGGFASNLVWSAILILRNGLAKQFLGEPGINPMRAVATSGDTLVDFDPLDPSTYDRLAPGTLIANYMFAALGGAFWYIAILFYFAGWTRTARFGHPAGALYLIATLLFAALWGLIIKEWRGASSGTRTLVLLGLALLLASTAVLAYGHVLQASLGF